MVSLRSDQPSRVTLVDILDRVLDKGLVVAGDIQVSLANVELLTIKLRLVICSVDKATEIGLDWWRNQNFLSNSAQEINKLSNQIADLERKLAASQLIEKPQAKPARRAQTRARRKR